MNKTKLFFILMGMIIFLPSFSSCSNDDPKGDNPLKGTTWVADDYLYSYLFGGEWFLYLEFNDGSNYTKYHKKSSGKVENKIKGKYTFDKVSNKVTLISADGSTDTYTLNEQGNGMNNGMFYFDLQ